MHLKHKHDKPHDHEKKVDSSETSATDSHPHAHVDNVALPEVRTGKVDVDGAFHEKQHADSHHGVHFDTLAVPEYHTGKCPHYDPESKKKDHKHHGPFSDLARLLANGTLDD